MFIDVTLNFVLCFIDIDECESQPCLNNGTCTDEVNDVTCTCSEGFTGSRCETGKVKHINPKRILLCKYKTTFLSLKALKTCCYQRCGTTILHCYKLDIDECASSPCQNNATCIDDVGGYICDCQAGYTGQHCQTGENCCNVLLLRWLR